MNKTMLILLLALLAFGSVGCSPGFRAIESKSGIELGSLGSSGPLASILSTGFRNKLVDSSSFGYMHAYGPTIFYENGVYHAYYCSSGLDQNFGGEHDWDSIRHVTSTDGLNWSAPEVALKTSNFPAERCSCDPSVVFFEGMYYLFYSGNSRDRQTVMFVARAQTPSGPFAKWDGGGWVVDSPEPKAIIGPIKDVPDVVASRDGWYGAGQQTVVNINGVLHSWFTDDSAGYPDAGAHRLRIYYGTSSDGIHWSRAETNVIDTASIDVKFDVQGQRFVMFDFDGGHQKDVALRRRYSQDGVNWSNPETICDSGCMPDYANNVGVSGDREGHLLSPHTLVAFGAPFDLREDYSNDACKSAGQESCWGRWDLYGGLINSTGPAKAADCDARPQVANISRAESKTAFSDWPVDLIRDRNPMTVFSSTALASLDNNQGEYVAFWFDRRYDIKDLHIGARYIQGVLYGFPLAYRIYVTSPDNKEWVFVGDYPHQPGADGTVHLALNRSYSTYGMMIIPYLFRPDDPAGPFFQISDVTPVYYEYSCKN